jgi:hypothetical protein
MDAKWRSGSLRKMSDLRNPGFFKEICFPSSLQFRYLRFLLCGPGRSLTHCLIVLIRNYIGYSKKQFGDNNNLAIQPGQSLTESDRV